MPHQRRGGSGGTNFTAVPTQDDNKNNFADALGPVDGTYELDAPPNATPESMSIEEQYEHERHAAKLRYWKEHPHCTGLVEISWKDEVQHASCMEYSNDSMDPSCCNYVSGLVCSRLGTGRVGNMVVLKQSTEWVEQVTTTDEEEDGENAESGKEEKTNNNTTVRRFTRPRYHVLVGPFWPMLVCVTYPLILGVSGWTLYTAIPGHSIILVFIWSCCTLGLIAALTLTSCRDPGILPKHTSPPPQDENSWRWNDQAQSYRPKGAIYDTDCAVIIEEFDHTCPWTGTAIGKRNMRSFEYFLALVGICSIMDLALLLANAITKK